MAQTNEQRVIWADNAMKLNRKDAKVSDGYYQWHDVNKWHN